MRKAQRAVLATMACALLGSTEAGATVVLEVGLEEMTHTSAAVLWARVERVDVVAPPDEPGAIFTDVTFEALEVLKGTAWAPAGRLSMRLLGGSYGGMELRIPGVPGFVPGEEVVVFLEKTADSFALCGLQQGVFRVQVDGGTGDRTVSRRLSGLGFARFGAKGRFEMSDAPMAVEGLPLSDFLAEIRWYVDQETARLPLQEAPQEAGPAGPTTPKLAPKLAPLD